MSSGNVLFGVLAGAAAGAAIGILFAPDKGSETRRKITEKSDAYADVLGTRFHELIESLAQQFDSLKEEATKKVEHAKHTAQDLETKLLDVAKHES